MIRIAAVWVAALVAVCPGAAGAQVGTVSGRVVGLGGAAVEGAEVRVLPAGPTTTTDSAGTFRLGEMAKGHYRLVVRRPGFRPDTAPIAVPTPQASITIVLAPVPILLNAIHTTADSLVPLEYRFLHKYDDFFLHRAESNGGYFFTREQMDARGGVGEAIQSLAGVRVNADGMGQFTVRMVRCPRSSTPALVVNGVLSSWSTLSTIPASDILLVEVYTGVADMPAETRGNACGALVIYTK